MHSIVIPGACVKEGPFSSLVDVCMGRDGLLA